jgi:hypothetical protein
MEGHTMRRRLLSRTVGGLVLAAAASGTSTARAETTHPRRMSLHVGSADPVMMNVALHNIIAAVEYYAARKETVAIELGPVVNSRRERGIELQLGFASCGTVVSGGLVA